MTNHEQFNNKPNLPIESNDDALLRMLSGANFGPGAKIILPSGKELSGDEAQAFTSAFSDGERDADSFQEPTVGNDRVGIETLRGSRFNSDAEVILPTGRNMGSGEVNASNRVPEIGKGDNPLDSHLDDWTGDPGINRARLVERARAAAEFNRETSKVEEKRNMNTEPQPQEVEKAHKKKWWKRNR